MIELSKKYLLVLSLLCSIGINLNQLAHINSKIEDIKNNSFIKKLNHIKDLTEFSRDIVSFNIISISLNFFKYFNKIRIIYGFIKNNCKNVISKFSRNKDINV
jgi:hypothetical protein